MNDNEITIILTLTEKPQKELKVLGAINLDTKIFCTQESALFNTLENLELSNELVLGNNVDVPDTATWKLSAKGVKKQAQLKKEGWYLG